MMRIPECLSQRYKALDDLIQELSSSISSQNLLSEQRSNTSNVGIKLMCDFWNILKEDPDCNLTVCILCVFLYAFHLHLCETLLFIACFLSL